MAQTPDFTVTARDIEDRDTILFTLNLKIKHFRQFEDNGRKVKQCGGHTIISDSITNTMFSSKCRMTEQFSRRKGLLVCLQKMSHGLPFRGIGEPLGGKDILEFESLDRGMSIFLGNSPNEGLWWLH